MPGGQDTGFLVGVSQGWSSETASRHIERTRVLIHLLDGAASDPLIDWATINQELALYDAPLEEKPQLVVLNKIDLPDGEAWEPLIAERMEQEGYPFCAISAVTGQGVRDMLFRVRAMLDEAPSPLLLPVDEPVIRPSDDDAFYIDRENGGWRIRGKAIERVASMTYFEFDETLARFQKILESMGITAAMEEAGVQVGDTVYIGDQELEWGE